MYYNKRDSKGRFTKTCKKGCTCSKERAEAPYRGTYTGSLINDCEVICRNATTEQLKDIFNTVVKDMKSLQVPKENLDNIVPFLTVMHTFYELALKGALFARELDKRESEDLVQKNLAKKNLAKKPITKKCEGNKAFEDMAFDKVKDVADMLGLPADAIQDFVFMDLNTGECCEAHRKCKK